MNKRQLYHVGQIARRVRRLILKKLGVDSTHSALCGVAAIPLCAELKAKGYSQAFVVQGTIRTEPDGSPYCAPHFWVEVDGFVVDITADQFNYILVGQKIPEVLIAPYSLLPRYQASRKDGIKLTGDLENFFTEWLQTIR